MTQDYYKSETTKHYDIPLAHLDYGYIRSCSDVKELEKILRVLRSGDEGCYPELEKEAEEKLQQLNPKSRVLRKDNPALQLRDLDQPERENLDHDLEAWRSDMADKEQMFCAGAVNKKPGCKDEDFEEDSSLPPVRTSRVISVDGKVKEDASQSTDKPAPKKKPLPRSYKEWDKIDIDRELEKVDVEETPAKNKDAGPSTFKPERIAHQIDTEGMSDPEKRARAVREKEKGNEAFHAHDFEEALVYYTRSISLTPLAATYNNRALAYLRLSKWNEVIKDCNYVLKLEPQNVKALLRRGTALKGKQDYVGARSDLDAVLALESNNKTAQDLLKEITTLEEKAKKEAQERKQSGRRMIIEEVDGEDEDEDEDVTEEIIVEKPDCQGKDAPLVNGHAEEAAPAAQPHTRLSDPEPASKAEVPNQPAGPDREQQEESSRGVECEANKDIWGEEEVEPAQQQQQEHTVADQKAKLVATNILSDQGRPQNGAGAEACQEGSSAGSGDATTVHAEALSDSRQQTVAPSGDRPEEESRGEVCEQAAASSDEKSEESNTEDTPESVQNAEGDTDRGATEPEPSHSRPVFVQKAFPPAMADLREKGNNFFRCGQYPEAIQVYTEIIGKLETASEQVVNLSLMYSNRAACYLKIGDSRSAITDCETSLALVPHSSKPLLRRAAAYEALEKYHLAYVDYKHALSIDHSTILAHQGASRCQHSLQNRDGLDWRQKLPPLVQVSQWDVPEIIDEMSSNRNVPAPQPSKQPAHSATAVKDVQAQSQDKAQQEAAVTKEVPEKKVPSAEERFEEIKARGNKHVQKGEYEAAAQCYCQCLELFSDRAAVFTNRALCYLKLNKPQEAEEDCSKALALEPSNFKAFYRRALAKKAQKFYKDSLQDLLQLLRLEPTNTAAKKEMELVKKLYKEEYDQLKAQPTAEEKKAAKPEKKRKRIKIEEVAEDSDTDEKDAQPLQASATRPKSSGAAQKAQAASPSPAGTVHKPPASHPATTATDKQTARAPEARKPGRGKSKKGGIKETSVGLPVTPPSAPKLQGKITPFEFIQHWNSLKQAKEIQPYVQLLEQISPDDLPGVISNKLDGHMLQIITRCAAHDAQTGEIERAYNILHNIRQVPRFSTVVMFLSNKERQDIRKVLDSVSSLGTHSTDEVTAVRKDYGVK